MKKSIMQLLLELQHIWNLDLITWKTFLKNEGMKLLESFLQMQPYWVCKQNSMSPYFSNCTMMLKLSLESKKVLKRLKQIFNYSKWKYLAIYPLKQTDFYWQLAGARRQRQEFLKSRTVDWILKTNLQIIFLDGRSASI